MKVSIVRENNLVVVDGVGIDGLSMDSVAANIHAVQWDGQSGTIEYVPNEHNEIIVQDITSIEQFQTVINEWQVAYDAAHQPPTDQQLKDACEVKAKFLLAKTDWSVLPDVAITNKAEFETYRQQIRQLVFTPVTNPVWPTEPKPVWS